jgi:hypothetical protein
MEKLPLPDLVQSFAVEPFTAGHAQARGVIAARGKDARMASPFFSRQRMAIMPQANADSLPLENLHRLKDRLAS